MIFDGEGVFALVKCVLNVGVEVTEELLGQRTGPGGDGGGAAGIE